MEKTKKNCPYCGEEIMTIAKKCKHCGSWLEEREATFHEVRSYQQEKHLSNPSPQNRRYLIVTIVACLCLAGIFIAFRLYKSDVSNNVSASESSIVQDKPECPYNWQSSVFEGRICVSTNIDGKNISTEIRETLIVYLTCNGEIIMKMKDAPIPENYYLSFNQNGSPAIIPCEVKHGAIYIQAPEAIKRCLELFDYEEMDIAIVDELSNGYLFTYSGNTKDAKDAMNYITQLNK